MIRTGCLGVNRKSALWQNGRVFHDQPEFHLDKSGRENDNTWLFAKSNWRFDLTELKRNRTMTTKTYMAKPGEVEQTWHVVDASDQVLGRLAAAIAPILQGKHRPEFTPHVDTGDFVIVLNASRIKLTGANKPAQRVFKRFSGYPSGLKETPLAEVLKDNPEKVITDAVRRMLPKSKLGLNMLKKLKVYAGEEHPHQAQNPQPLEL
jgi:large subunit ribosomal protein L13